MTRLRRARWLVLLAALLAADAGPRRVPPVAAAPLAQAVGLTYRLSETWSGRPWSLTPGRYGRVADISSAPGGTTWSLFHVLHGDELEFPFRRLTLFQSLESSRSAIPSR